MIGGRGENKGAMVKWEEKGPITVSASLYSPLWKRGAVRGRDFLISRALLQRYSLVMPVHSEANTKRGALNLA